LNHQEKSEEDRQIWKERIAELSASGLTVAQYGKTQELSVHQIYYWKSKFANNSEKSSPPHKRETVSPLVKIISKAEIKSSKLPDPKWVAELIKALHEVF